MPPKKAVRKLAKKAARKPIARKITKTTLSAAHRRALAEGRATSSTVDRYLSAVNEPKKRGRKLTKEALEQRLAAARTRFDSATGTEKVMAAQTVRDTQTKLAQMRVATATDIKSLEGEFVKVAKRFGENRGISYGSWRDAGVPAAVLKKAGVARTRG